jgi:hypothetical protein
MSNGVLKWVREAFEMIGLFLLLLVTIGFVPLLLWLGALARLAGAGQ